MSSGQTTDSLGDLMAKAEALAKAHQHSYIVTEWEYDYKKFVDPQLQVTYDWVEVDDVQRRIAKTLTCSQCLETKEVPNV